MESNKLTTLDKNLPLRAYPQENLNRVLIMDFLPWLSNLLSLTDETSANRLELALPAIKDQCIGMGFVEIKKMFEMYADGKLGITPISNFFDRVLLGKIIDNYRSYKNRINKPKIKIAKPSESEQERIMIDAIDRVKKEVKDTGEIHGTAHHVYDFMIDTRRMEKPDAATRKACYKIALRNQIGEFEKNAKLDYSLKKQLIKTLSNLGAGNDRTIKMAKTLALADYFRNK